MNAELFGTSLESFIGALAGFGKVLSSTSPIPEKKDFCNIWLRKLRRPDKI